MKLNMIDVSEHNGKINWEQAKGYIDGVIVRCGYGMDMESQDDKWWKYNANECTRLGIPFGVYLYSYADTDEKSRSEAAHVLRLIKGYKLFYPVYLDLEEESGPDTRSHAVRGARIFADILERAGYQVGIYANENWYRTIIGNTLDNYTKWVAKYSFQAPNISDVDIWQYSGSGSLPGVGGEVDMNYCFRDFSVQKKGGYTFRTENVSMRSKGASALLLQEILKARGLYKGNLDGDSGIQTVEAINAYQTLRRQQGAEVGTDGHNDGCCGPAMWRDLISL